MNHLYLAVFCTVQLNIKCLCSESRLHLFRYLASSGFIMWFTGWPEASMVSFALLSSQPHQQRPFCSQWWLWSMFFPVAVTLVTVTYSDISLLDGTPRQTRRGRGNQVVWGGWPSGEPSWKSRMLGDSLTGGTCVSIPGYPKLVRICLETGSLTGIATKVSAHRAFL